MNGKVEILVPTTFTTMDTALRDSKYSRSNKPPGIAYTNEDASVNLILDIKQNPAMLAVGLKGALENNFIKNALRIPSFEMLDNGIITQQKREFAFAKFSIKAQREVIYNLIYFTIEGDKFYFASFNSTEEHWDYWQEAAKEIMASFKLK